MAGARDTADYERSEEVAIRDGKSALGKARWLSSRKVKRASGFFFELSQNDAVHPDYYALHCVDGVGTKLFLSAWSGDYTLQPQDGIAMNANDMATAIRAYPDSVNLYFAVQTPVEEQHMGDIMSGFVRALELIRVPNAPFEPNIGKIETASLDEMISLGVKGEGWDVGVVMNGFIRKGEVPKLDPKPGNVIVGVSSTGLHSNGYTGARHVLLTSEVEYREEWKRQYRGRFNLNSKPKILEGQTILGALQTPTAIYLRSVALVGQMFDSRDIYGVNITGNGLHNFNRAGKNVSFEITEPLEPLPIHKLLVQESGWAPTTAYTKQNMGMGFALIAPSLRTAEGIVRLVNQESSQRAAVVGEVMKNSGRELRTTIHKPYEGPAINFVGY